MKLKYAALVKQKEIDLSRETLKDTDIGILCEAVAHTRVLDTLKLSSAELTFADGRLANALARSKTLQRLWLRNNRVGDEGARALADMVKSNKRLKSLLLTGNQITARGAGCLARALITNKKLKTLALNQN